MENREAIEKLERQSKLICLGCIHPSMIGWCENHCQLPEAFNMAISALEKQLVDKCCETCKYKTQLLEKWRCRECYRESNREDYWEPYTEEEL